LGPCIYAMPGYAQPLARTEPFWENRSKKKTRKHKHSYVNNNKRYIDCGILTIINGGRCLSTLERSSSSCAILRQSHSLNFTQLWYYQIACFLILFVSFRDSVSISPYLHLVLSDWWLDLSPAVVIRGVAWLIESGSLFVRLVCESNLWILG